MPERQPEPNLKELQKEWDKKLGAVGLSEKLEPLPRVPVQNVSAKEILTTLVPDIEPFLKNFKVLPSEIQDGILIYARNKRDTGMFPRDILNRLEILITKSQELEKMTEEDSDKVYKPKLPELREEDVNMEEKNSQKVDEFIRRAEEIRQEDGPDEPGGPRNIN